ncbi:MAG TPA: hypothetical protein VGF76_06960, partial [Polyangiaceae bacterium]
NVATGIEQAFGALMAQAAGEDPPSDTQDPAVAPSPLQRSPFGLIAILLLLAPFVIPLILFSGGRGGRGGRGGGFWGGGGFGGGGFGGGGFGGGGFGGGGGGGGGFSGGGGGFGGGGSSGSW